MTDVNSTFVPDALFVPMPPEQIEQVPQFGYPDLQPMNLPIVLYGNLHMLNWPTDEAEQKTLLSRCADHVLDGPISRYEEYKTYAVYAARRPPAAVDWAAAIQQLKRVPAVVQVVVADAGDGWALNYFDVARPQARKLGRLLAKGMAKHRPQLH